MRMKLYQRSILHLLIILSILIVGAPVLLSIIISTQTPAQVYSYPPKCSRDRIRMIGHIRDENLSV